MAGSLTSRFSLQDSGTPPQIQWGLLVGHGSVARLIFVVEAVFPRPHGLRDPSHSCRDVGNQEGSRQAGHEP